MERTGLSLLSEIGTGYPYFGEEIRSRPQGVVWKTNYQPAPLWICWWKVLGDRLKKHRESKGLLFLCRSYVAVAPAPAHQAHWWSRSWALETLVSKLSLFPQAGDGSSFLLLAHLCIAFPSLFWASQSFLIVTNSLRYIPSVLNT